LRLSFTLEIQSKREAHPGESAAFLAEDFGTKAHYGVDDPQLSKAAFMLTSDRLPA
jgi:hypothetical protein